MPLDTDHVNALLSVVHQTVQLPKLSGLRDLAMAELEHLHTEASAELAEIAKAAKAKADAIAKVESDRLAKLAAEQEAKDKAQAERDAAQKPLPFAERRLVEGDTR